MLTQGYAGLPLMCAQVSDGIVLFLLLFVLLGTQPESSCDPLTPEELYFHTL